MEVNKATIELIKRFEGLKLNAYLCPAGIATIGYGSTYYPNGTRVKMGDTCTQVQAEFWLLKIVGSFALHVQKGLTKPVNENQFGAMVSLAYNVGIANFYRSTLLKKVNANPNDESIGAEFLRWNKAGGKVLAGLTKRRQAEKELYFA